MLSAEPPPRHARLLAITTGTVGLLAVGLILVTVTPRRADGPIALASTTTATTTATTAAPARIASGPPASAARPIALAPGPSVRSAGPVVARAALATPIGDGRFALVTRASLEPGGAVVVDVRLPSGRTSSGEIVTASEHAVVVALATAEQGHAVAHDRPADDEIVTIMATPPVEIRYADAHTVPADEGVAVLDASGDLIGLCTRRTDSDSTHIIEVVAELADATSVVP